jgi:phage replication-related protein YjqB (UPF0714/DUF867 family)
MLRERHFVLKFMVASHVSTLAVQGGYISQGVSKYIEVFHGHPHKVNHFLAGEIKAVKEYNYHYELISVNFDTQCHIHINMCNYCFTKNTINFLGSKRPLREGKN